MTKHNNLISDKFRLQFISHFTTNTNYLDGIRLALAGGCRWIQLRMKGADDDEVRPIAVKVKEMCREADATFIIDDRVDLVKELHADGVHLGKNDMPIAEARHILGPDYIIGGTANTFEDIRQLHLSGADYIGCGPFRFTTTKERLAPLLGLDGYKHIISQMKQEGITLPLVAIGGITLSDIPQIMQTGVDGIAMSGSILNADNPTKETKNIITSIEKWKN